MPENRSCKNEGTLLERIQAVMTDNGWMRHGGTLLVGVSGGADSMALLHGLNHLVVPGRWKLVAAHLNHHLRGRAAAGDLHFVEKTARELHLGFVGGEADVKARAAAAGVSIEMAARAARQDFFRAAVRATGASAAALAHTADDQVELFFLRLARGTGPRGIGGMEMNSAGNGLRIIRPLLTSTHAEAMAFLKSRGLRWREDVSNADPAYLRNRVRHRILPLLEKELNPALRKSVLRLMDLARDEDDYLAGQAGLELTACGRGRGLDAQRLRALHPALARRVLVAWLRQRGAPDAMTEADKLAAILSGCRSLAGSRILLEGEGICVDRRYDILSVRPLAAAAPADGALWPLVVPGRTDVPALGLRVETCLRRGLVRETGRPGQWPAVATLAIPNMSKTHLTLRYCQAGDAFRPLGAPGRRKLQDIFTDLKVPRAERRRIPLLVAGDEIVWVPGYRIAHDWRRRDPRQPSLQIRITLEPIRKPLARRDGGNFRGGAGGHVDGHAQKRPVPHVANEPRHEKSRHPRGAGLLALRRVAGTGDSLSKDTPPSPRLADAPKFLASRSS